jgi:hypothetical protein
MPTSHVTKTTEKGLLNFREVTAHIHSTKLQARVDEIVHTQHRPQCCTPATPPDEQQSNNKKLLRAQWVRSSPPCRQGTGDMHAVHGIHLSQTRVESHACLVRC